MAAYLPSINFLSRGGSRAARRNGRKARTANAEGYGLDSGGKRTRIKGRQQDGGRETEMVDGAPANGEIAAKRSLARAILSFLRVCTYLRPPPLPAHSSRRHLLPPFRLLFSPSAPCHLREYAAYSRIAVLIIPARTPLDFLVFHRLVSTLSETSIEPITAPFRCQSRFVPLTTDATPSRCSRERNESARSRPRLYSRETTRVPSNSRIINI